MKWGKYMDIFQRIPKFRILQINIPGFFIPLLLIQEMLRDTVTNLLLLDPEEIARQLTLKSFETFRKIRTVEYVTDLLGLKSGYGQANLEVSGYYILRTKSRCTVYL